MTVSLDIQKPENSAPTRHYDAVVVGAGPYGLSTAAHLLGQGLKVAVFGKPISYWQEHMPKGMLLRSFWWASTLSDPEKKYRIDRYFHAFNQSANDPLPVETFIEYGQWFQKQAVPDVDETFVAAVERKEQQFEVRLVDGRVVYSSAVIMAPGLFYYIHRPHEYDHLPAELVSHASDHRAFDRFAGQRVIVIGGGQSALETAALLRETNAQVQLITRRPLFWLPTVNTEIPFFIRQLQAPKVGLGYGWINWALEKYPYAFLRLPRATKDRMLATFHGPAGASWLKERVLGKVPVHEQQVAKIEEAGSGLQLSLANTVMLEADHVILATGYRADIKRLPMLHPSLQDAVQTYMGSPILHDSFESSVPGLYFIGFSSARSCGPLYRFVVGSHAAAQRVASSVARQIAGIGRY